MTSAVPSTADVLEKVDALGPPGTPVTTPEVAEGFDCTQRTIYNRLEALAEEDTLLTKKVGANSRVWWRPVDGDIRRNGGASDHRGPVSLREDQSLSFTADSEMAERIREFDWADTPLGPMDEWPQELRVAVDIMLGADEAIGIYWGEELILLYNDLAQEQIGKKHPDALGRPAREVFPEAWETLAPMHEQVMAGEGAVRVEEKHLPIERGDEVEDVWWDSSFSPIPCADGSVGGVLNVSIDVTDRVQAEAALRERQQEIEARLDVAVRNSPLTVWQMDTDYRYTWLKHPREEFEVSAVLGKRDDELLPPDAAETVMGPKRRAMETGETVREEVTYDLPTGETVSYDLTVAPLRDENGEITGLTCAAFDISERKAAEEELRESEARLDSLVTTTTDLVYRMSPDWSDVYSLDGGVFIDDDDEERLETWLEEYIPEDEQERVAAAIEDAVENKRPFDLEHEVFLADGTRGWTRSRAVPILDDDGEITEWFGTATDITERKEMEEELRESEARVSKLLAQLPLGVGVLNADGVYELRNDRMREILDGDLLPSRDPEKQSDWNATDADGDPLPPEQWPGARALRGESVSPGIEFRLDRGGETRWFNVAGVPFEESPGGPKAIGVVQEITERREMEEALRKNEARLSQILAQVPVAIGIVDTEGMFTLQNDRMQSLIPPGKVPSRDRDKMADWHGTDDDGEPLPPEQWPAARALRGEDISAGIEFRYEPEETSRWMNVAAVPFREDGEITGAIVTIEDTTERKEAERAIRESEERLDAFVTTTSEVVYRMSPDWSEMYYLDGQEFIVDTEEPRETWLTEYIPDDEQERVMAAIEEAIETKSTFDLEHQVVQTDGTRGWVHSRAVPMLDDDGEISEWFGTATDITERKRQTRALEERTEELEEARTRLEIASEAGSVGLYTVNVDEDRMIADPYVADCYGVDPDRAADGAPVDDFVAAVHEDDTERVLQEFETALTETGRLETEYRVRNRDGDVVWLISRGTVEYDDAGNPRRLHGAVSDISDQKHREQRDQFLLELSDTIRGLTDEEEIGEVCTRLLAEELGLDRAYFARFFPDREEALVEYEYHSSGLDPVGGLYPYSAFPDVIRQVQTETLVYDDIANASTIPEAERQALLELDFGAWIGARIGRDEHETDWLLGVTFNEPHDWTKAEVSLIEDVADRIWTAVERARAEQSLKASNDSLERLNDVNRLLIDADPKTIRNRVPEHIVDILGIEYAALWQYNERTGDLEMSSDHVPPETDVDAVRPLDVSHDQIWKTFIDDEIHVDDALDLADGDSSPSRLGSRVFAPLGRHGVIVVGSVESETIDGRLLDLVKTVASTIETAWDRAEGEEELARRNEELTRLNRLNTLIREIDKALVAADTREEIDEAVCERLASSDLYEFVWVGEYDPATDVVEPRAWAGIDSAYLEDHVVTVKENPTDRDPIGQAVRTGDLQVVADIATDSRVASWREAALERGARSLVCIPLVYDDATYGVLTVYADRPQSEEDERNQEVLSELGDTIAHTLNARETRATLQTDSVVELTLQFEDADTPLCRLAREAACTIEHQGFVPRSSGQTDVFFIARGISPEDLRDTAERSLAFDDLDCLTEGPDGSLFRARVSDPTLAARVTDEGAVVRSITIDAGVATAVLDVPHTAAVREFLDRLRQWNPDFELRARQSRERPLKTRQTFVTALEDRLTDRQREVLQTAYLSGFFEVPRVSNGQEVTELLGVSQPTFSEHLRAAERTLCEVLFENEAHAGPLT